MQQTVLGMENLLSILGTTNDKEMELLHAIIEQMLTVGHAIEMDLLSFREAIKYQKNLDLSPQDSIIYAAIVSDLKKRQQAELKCFLSRDKKAFSAEDDDSLIKATKERDKKKIEAKGRIETELKAYGCKYFSNFDGGLNYIQRFA